MKRTVLFWARFTALSVRRRTEVILDTLEAQLLFIAATRLEVGKPLAGRAAFPALCRKV